MESGKFAEQLGAAYRESMSDEHVFHAVSNLVMIASIPFDRMMEERGVDAETILNELQTIARGTLLNFSTDGFDPVALSDEAVKKFPELHKQFMEENQRPTILDAVPEIIQ